MRSAIQPIMSNEYTKRELANDILTAIDAYCDASGIKVSDLNHYRSQFNALRGEYRRARPTGDTASHVEPATPDALRPEVAMALMVQLVMSLPCDDSDN